MHKIYWHGNDGSSNPMPGTVETVDCGVCNIPMNVKRNVLGATSHIEVMAGRSHRHDHFFCSHIREGWHGMIYRLKLNVYTAEINKDVDYEEKKKAAEKEIMEILKANAVR